MSEAILAALEKARSERDELREVIRETIKENLHLADGDVCTLKRLKDAIEDISGQVIKVIK